MKRVTLVTGGARSGKSRFAQELAGRAGGPVLFVATAEARDEEMRRRIAEHRRQRPAEWRTIEAPTQVGQEIQRNIGAARLVIVDCVTLLVNNIFNRHDCSDEALDADLVEKEAAAEVEGLIACLGKLDASFLIVTNEVGLGLVPPNVVGRVYRDVLGKANQMLAAQADEVYLLVAGIPVRVKPAS